MAQKDLGKTSLGIPANIEAALSYFLGFASGIIFYFLERENRFVRFHAIQSTIVFAAFFVVRLLNTLVLSLILPYGVRSIISVSIGLLIFAFWIIMMIVALMGEELKVPIAGDIAEKKA